MSPTSPSFTVLDNRKVYYSERETQTSIEYRRCNTEGFHNHTTVTISPLLKKKTAPLSPRRSALRGSRNNHSSSSSSSTAVAGTTKAIVRAKSLDSFQVYTSYTKRVRNANFFKNYGNCNNHKNLDGKSVVYDEDDDVFLKLITHTRKRINSTGGINLNNKNLGLMRRITFEEIDLKSTPLSNLRSITEFNRINSNTSASIFAKNTHNSSEVKRKRGSGILKYLFSPWKSSSKSARDGDDNKVKDTHQDDTFIVENFTRSKLSSHDDSIYDALDENELFNNISSSSNKRRNYKYSDTKHSSKFDADVGYKTGCFFASPIKSNNYYDTNSSSSTSSKLKSKQLSASNSLLYDTTCMPSPFTSPAKKINQPHRSIDSTEGMTSFVAASNDIHYSKSHHRYGYQRKSLVSEMTVALDVVFGINANRYNNEPMEIELRPLKSSIVSTPRSSLSRSQQRSSNDLSIYGDDNDNYDGSNIDSRGDIPHANIASRTIGRIVSELSNYPSTSSLVSLGGNSSGLSETIVAESTQLLQTHTNNSYIGHIKYLIDNASHFHLLLQPIVVWSRNNLFDSSDDFFYDTMRIQPFASGAYLRGALSSGFSSLFFNVYTLVLWPNISKSNPRAYNLSLFMYGWLILQLTLNIIQLPLRINLHLRCWESSRSIDVEVAINHLRQLIHCDTWVINRAIARLQDVISLLTIVMTEVYLMSTDSNDSVRGLVLSICATDILSIVVRIIVVTAFAISMHDPQVLADARRRGLSRWDIETLPTFVFADFDEVNNNDCSICLSNFDMGEMLICLPCDRKHSFHATCIRQWLHRQNSCPLCQKLI